MKMSAAWWRRLIILSGVIAGSVTFGSVLPALRPFVVLPFLLLGPGIAWVRLLRLESPLAELTLALAVSLVLATAVAAGMLYAGAWSPKGSFAVLLALTVVALVLDASRDNARRRCREEVGP